MNHVFYVLISHLPISCSYLLAFSQYYYAAALMHCMYLIAIHSVIFVIVKKKAH